MEKLSLDSLPNDVDTIPRLIRHLADKRGDAIVLRQKILGIWQAQSWPEFSSRVDEIALGLLHFGIENGEAVAILSNTTQEWLWVDLGAQSAGAMVFGIYPTSSAEQVHHMCTDSNSHYLFVENEEQLDKFIEVRDRLPGIRKVFVFDMEGLEDLDDPQITSLEKLIEAGTNASGLRSLLEERIAGRRSGDVSMLVYTSGTTGAPKGSMLTHANTIAAVRNLYEFLPKVEQGERVAFLPLCHVSERILGAYCALFAGDVLNFVEDPDTVFENMREVQPEVFMAVPRVWEKLYSSISIALREATPLQRWATERSLRLGTRIADLRRKNKAPSAALRTSIKLAQFFVLGNIRRSMGLDRVKVAVTGAAPISPDLIRWFESLGIELVELWGMTELTGVTTCNPHGRSRPGSVGVPIPGMEIRLSPEGEILARGNQLFAGYLGMPDKTAEVIADGWLRTGDIGRVDEDGYLYITDRIKDIIITAGGKNITPSEWENQLKFSPFVTDAIVIGDKRPYLTAIVMIDQENVERWAQEHEVAFTDYRSLARSKEVIAMIRREVEQVNAKMARVEQIKDFRLLDVQLNAEDEELTPTMKLKRKLVQQKYGDIIETMYTSPAGSRGVSA